jgi:hypothetical protein
MDIFSRKIVGWQVYEAESSELAGDLIPCLTSTKKQSLQSSP